MLTLTWLSTNRHRREKVALAAVTAFCSAARTTENLAFESIVGEGDENARGRLSHAMGHPRLDAV
jgi:hypothetical protein